MPHGICLVKMVFDQSKKHLNVVLTNQKYQSKWLVENANLGLVKKYMAQSQWTSSKQLVQNERKIFLTFVQNGSFLTHFQYKKIRNSSSVICRLINLAWRSEVGVRWWCTISKLHWMSTSIRWCCKWMWLMFLTPSCVKPSSNNFVQQETSCLCVSFLSNFFMASNYPCSLVIIPSRDNFMFSFRLWAHVKVTRSLGLFLLWLIFMPYEPFLLFFLHVSSIRWQMTLTSLALLPLFPSLLTILLPNWPLWVYLFSFASALFGSLLACTLISPPLMVFVALQMTLKSQGSPFALCCSPFPFRRTLWMKMSTMLICSQLLLGSYFDVSHISIFTSCVPALPKLLTLTCIFQFDLYVGF